MKNVFITFVFAAVLFSGTTTFATNNADSDNGSGIGEIANTPVTAEDYVPVAVCYTQYRGYYGWGNYYGWAYNMPQAQWNAVNICQNQHANDPYSCYVTGCQWQY